MRSKYLRLQLLIVLIFGLISCSSDRDDPAKTSFEVLPQMAPVIMNTDGTFRRVEDTNVTSITSLLDLGLQPEIIDQTFAVSHVKCKTNFLPTIVEHKQEFKHINHISILQTLPIEVFTPSKDISRQVICQHEFNIYINDQYSGQVIFKNLDLKDTESFSNYPLSFLENRETNYFTKSELDKEILLLPAAETEVQVLCQTTNKFAFSQIGKIDLRQLFDDTLFNNNTENCRFILKDMNSEDTWISPDFYVQKTQAQFELVDFQTFLTAHHTIPLSNKKIATIKIRNTSVATAHYRYKEQTSKINVTGFFSPVRNSKNLFPSRAISFTSYWRLTDTQEKESFIIPPNGTLSLDLYAEDATLICRNSSVVTSMVNSCEYNMKLTGLSYTIESFPNISMNQLDQSTPFKETIYKIPLANQKIWVPGPAKIGLNCDEQVLQLSEYNLIKYSSNIASSKYCNIRR